MARRRGGGARAALIFIRAQWQWALRHWRREAALASAITLRCAMADLLLALLK